MVEFGAVGERHLDCCAGAGVVGGLVRLCDDGDAGNAKGTVRVCCVLCLRICGKCREMRRSEAEGRFGIAEPEGCASIRAASPFAADLRCNGELHIAVLRRGSIQQIRSSKKKKKKYAPLKREVRTFYLEARR